MSASAREEINFWPGYVDALINVVLNLLFLVGVFTVGLVVLNLQVAMVQREMARQEIRQMIEDSAPADQVRQLRALEESLRPLTRGPDPALAPLAAGMAPDEVSNVTTDGRAAAATQPMTGSVAPTPPMPPADPEQPILEDPSATDMTQQQLMALPGKEIRIKRRASAVAGAAPEPSAEEAAGAVPVMTPEQSVAQWLAARFLAWVPFGVDQFTLSDASVLPASVLEDKTQNLELVVFSEPTNPRMAREAFSRVLAVRNGLVQSGYPMGQIQVRVLARPEGLNLPASAELFVIVVARP